MERKRFIEILKNPSDAWISLEQLVFCIISGISIYVFWETEWRWTVVIISVVLWIFLLAIRDDPNRRSL